MTTITALPTPPARTQAPATFSANADAFLAALPTFATQTNAVAGEINANTTTASTAATTATTQAGIATTQATNAGNSASSATASALTAVNAPGTAGTATDSLTIATGNQSLTIQTGKSLVIGMSMVVASTASPTNWMIGTVTSYNSSTGALVISVTGTSGSGTFSAWTVSLSAPQSASVNYPGQTFACVVNASGALPLPALPATPVLIDVYDVATSGTQVLTGLSGIMALGSLLGLNIGSGGAMKFATSTGGLTTFSKTNNYYGATAINGDYHRLTDTNFPLGTWLPPSGGTVTQEVGISSDLGAVWRPIYNLTGGYYLSVSSASGLAVYSPTTGAFYSVTWAGSGGSSFQVFPLGTGNYLVTSQNTSSLTQYATVINISGTTITAYTDYVPTTIYATVNSVVQLSATQYAFTGYSSTGYPRVQPFSISGTTITGGTAGNGASAVQGTTTSGKSVQVSAQAISSTLVLLTYNGTSQWACAVATITGNVATVGAEVANSVGMNTTAASICIPGSSSTYFLHIGTMGGTGMYYMPITITGSTPAYGTTVTKSCTAGDNYSYMYYAGPMASVPPVANGTAGYWNGVGIFQYSGTQYVFVGDINIYPFTFSGATVTIGTGTTTNTAGQTNLHQVNPDGTWFVHYYASTAIYQLTVSGNALGYTNYAGSLAVVNRVAGTSANYVFGKLYYNGAWRGTYTVTSLTTASQGWIYPYKTDPNNAVQISTTLYANVI